MPESLLCLCQSTFNDWRWRGDKENDVDQYWLLRFPKRVQLQGGFDFKVFSLSGKIKFFQNCKGFQNLSLFPYSKPTLVNHPGISSYFPNNLLSARSLFNVSWRYWKIFRGWKECENQQIWKPWRADEMRGLGDFCN